MASNKSKDLANGSSTVQATTYEATAPGIWTVVKRDHSTVAFDRTRIFKAIEKAFIASRGNLAKDADSQQQIERLATSVKDRLITRYPQGGYIHIEEIQDTVISRLAAEQLYSIAQLYSTYRKERKQERESQALLTSDEGPLVHLIDEHDRLHVLDWAILRRNIAEACDGVHDVDEASLLDQISMTIHDGMREGEYRRNVINTATDMIKVEPNYDTVAARLLLIQIRNEACETLGVELGGRTFKPENHEDLDEGYQVLLKASLQYGIDHGLLDAEILKKFDVDKLGKALVASRDLKFDFLGLQILFDRYLLQHDDIRFELPQVFWMRVAMFLAIQESNPEDRAIEFYTVLSTHRFVSSTPTLFNSGTLNPQLSSCYISTVDDDLQSIYGDQIYQNALLQKWAGGMGNDWTPIRALGSPIKGTNGKSEGVVPFLKVVDATAKAVNQGGKRAGAVCSYLETWHLDIEEFLDLRKNTGDHDRRTPSMNTANWIPDLFMKRVARDEEWTLFSPSDTASLHDAYGREFEELYVAFEAKADAGELKLFKRVKAKDLWRSMLRSLSETGHPWITFKDTCNIRSPQQHVGRVHSSNLCTEITLNTSKDEIAVCNLGSINLKAHMDSDGILDQELLRESVRTGIRMLDNVIDINFYAVDKAANSNLRHRPIGLGLMGFQDVLFTRRIPYQSSEAIEFADESMESISYYAIEASSDLAVERNTYPTYEGSLWSKGILPIDSLKMLEEERGGEFTYLNFESRMDWDALREKVRSQGMRNSNTMAIAPTATIANIVGSVASIEPFFMNTYVKQNMSGDFQVVNPYLTADLKERGLWTAELFDLILSHDGDLSGIDEIPEELKDLYKSAFEVGNEALILCGSRRQKWLDQSQSLNLYVNPARGVKGKEVMSWYENGWKLGLKTTYYLHSRTATSVEKTSSTDKRLQFVRHDSAADSIDETAVFETEASTDSEDDQEMNFCAIDDPTCESCAG